ncbi:LuxR family transcriptional regulator [Blastococcus sp. MG754426]|uniref:helix-turn-helix transcriptional regulator n=1 Tax=unclassified Blastococcus TaxID=2619396 RepID=UPI001EF08CB1|nr:MULTISPECIES: AAA family ATPase [unclassified Blastococcus]MCF6506173.1 LuxR family transcriptional regulator [Blastococcus sp. MG754426]MCF6510449.1 LuxR family transcriptional regulator [Blastococcus sp. MG754427]MCF6735582.1 LuxR family transcriptional regulator [Blastococcus sp. KM273129]
MSRWDDAPLVGRAEELARLLAQVERAAAGRACATLLAGDAGVGKTRLLDELGREAAARGLRVLTGHCVDLGDVGLPYLPFVDLLRPLAADPELVPAARANPVLTGFLAGHPGAVVPVPPPGEGLDLGRPLPHRAAPQPVDDGRLQLFESVAALLCELAAAGPLLVVLEDVHWADRSSRDLLRYLLARLVDEPVAVVASYRADDLHRRHPLRPLLAELVRLPGVERLDLAPLPDAAVGDLVRGLASADLPQSAVEDVVARAEGNAFYAEELLAAGLQGEALPLALADVLLARVEQRSPAAQRVLRVAAVAGRRVRHELVAAIGELAPDELERALAEVVHHHLLVVSDDGRYRFRHALLREAVLTDLLPGERVRLHAAIAGYLAAHADAGTAAERAHHARESNDLPGAFSASLEAASDACAVGAPAEQLQHLEAALALWPAVPDAAGRAGRDQVALLVETAAAARTSGELHRAAGLLRAALELVGPDGDPGTRARLHYTLAQALVRIEDHTGGYRESSAAMALVPAEPPSELRTWAAATHARMCFSLNLLAEGDAAAEEALAAADVLGLDAAWSDTAVSQVRSRPAADVEGVRRRLGEALERGRRSGDVDVEMRAWFNLAVDRFEAGDVPGAVALTGEATERARALGVEWATYPAGLRHLRVTALYTVGEWDASLAEADALARVPEMAAHVRAAALLVLVGRGDPAARDRLAWARSLVERVNAHYLLSLVTGAAEIDLAAWAGDAARAVDVAIATSARLREVWRFDHLGVLRLVATALGAVADAAAAARLVGDRVTADGWVHRGEELVEIARSAVEVFERSVGGMGVEGLAWRARVDAEHARLAGKAAPELWQAAAEAFGYGHVYEQARSRRRLAEALLATDDRAGAAVEARAAHEVAVRLGATPLREAVEALVRRGRLDVDLPGVRLVDPAAVLTPREQSVLALLAKGRTNRQIGAELYISEKTASVHVSNILAKLGANGRTEAVAIAAQRGLLPVP